MSHFIPPAPVFQAYDTTTQAIASAGAEQVITFNTVVFARGMELVTSGGKASRVTVRSSSYYFFSFSAIANSTSGNRVMQIWFKKNGTNIADSNTKFGVSNGIPVTQTVTLIEQMNVGDYVELWMTGNSTAAEIVATAAVAGPPAIPAVPSIIFTANKISD